MPLVQVHQDGKTSRRRSGSQTINAQSKGRYFAPGGKPRRTMPTQTLQSGSPAYVQRVQVAVETLNATTTRVIDRTIPLAEALRVLGTYQGWTRGTCDTPRWLGLGRAIGRLRIALADAQGQLPTEGETPAGIIEETPEDFDEYVEEEFVEEFNLFEFLTRPTSLLVGALAVGAAIWVYTQREDKDKSEKEKYRS